MESSTAGERSFMERAYTACERFTESKARCLVLSCALSLVVILVGTVAWYPVDANDDFYMAMALSGVWGQNEGLCLFINALMSQIIFFLNTAVPVGNWYALLELLTAFLSLSTLIYLLLTRVSLPYASMVTMAALAFTIPGVTWESNFTFVSILSIGAGGMAILMSLREQRHRASLVVLGLAFLCLGYIWRYEVFLLCIPAFGIAALVYVLSDGRRDLTVPKSLARLWPFFVALCLAGACFAYDVMAWQQEPWRDWVEFSNARSLLFDYPLKDYEEIADELNALGVSENDYAMLDMSITDDPDFFTTDLVEDVAEVATIDLFTPQRLAVSVESYFTRTFVDVRFLVILALAIVVALATTRGPTRRRIFAFMVLALVLSIVFAVIGRIPHRVHYPIWLFSFIAASLFVPRVAVPRSGHARDDVVRTGAARAVVGIASSAGVLAVSVAIIAFSAMNFSAERLEATYMPRTFEPDSTVIAYLDEHPENVYAFSTCRDIRFSYMLRGLPDHDVAYRMPSFGGWVSRAPYREEANRELGMTNMLKDLVDNDSALLIWRGKDNPDILLTYLREHYYPNCTYELVDRIESDSTQATLRVYKFSAGS